jgi:AcrR family transcriptional regulator
MKRTGEFRQQILEAGLKLFAERGYAGASVQDIIAATKVTKPVLYYYFKNKAGLYNALVHEASDEGFRLVTEAAARSRRFDEQLVEIFAAMFEFLKNRRDLVRLGFRAAFAPAGELPEPSATNKQGERLFGLVHSIIKQAQEAGNLDDSVTSLELANGIYGALCFQLMVGAAQPRKLPDRATAKRVVRLFLKGAESRGRASGGGERLTK